MGAIAFVAKGIAPMGRSYRPGVGAVGRPAAVRLLRLDIARASTLLRCGFFPIPVRSRCVPCDKAFGFRSPRWRT
jgi:hypothetical protein